MKRISVLGLLAVALAGLATAPRAQDSLASDPPALRRLWDYDEALVAAFARLPVQEHGRVKPFVTVADYLLIRLNERRSFTVPDRQDFGALAGKKLSSVEWALDMMLFPEQARTYPVIVVPDREVLDLIGLTAIADTKRQRHSWNELEPGLRKLDEFYREFRHVEEGKRSRIQNLVVYLYTDLVEFDNLCGALAGLRARFTAGDSRLLAAAFGSETKEIGFAQSLRRVDRTAAAWQALGAGQPTETDPAAADAAERQKESERLGALLTWTERRAFESRSLAWIPPLAQDGEEWLVLGNFAQHVVTDGADAYGTRLDAVDALQRMVDAAGDQAALSRLGVAFVDSALALSATRADARKVAGEVGYLAADWFGRALYCFLFGFLAAAFSWLRLRSVWIYRTSWALGLAGAGCVVYGLTQRCLLLERPPVSTLYETILFVTGIAVLVALFIEWVGRRRIALSLAVLLGAVGMFIAYRYEFHKGSDTLEELRAVLRTNFWLGVHVTTVTIGYSATLLAGFIAHVYLLGKCFGLRRGDAGFYQGIGRMVYGVLCFAAFFATFGTITGGIWANDSWGRFWGWDPKENGALMIVLAQLVILHGRMGGLWRNWGMAFLAVLANVVVAFSWWHVNALGIGLHTYGFDAGLYAGTMTFYGTQGLVLLLGGWAWLRERRAPALGQNPGGTRDAGAVPTSREPALADA
ncbi:MAG: cytochrome c biogenesis protein CcsA [Planctomycetes bacterium]|nr:cytochrome c biogenesis protein CcsA [Planctomycetota bacterium]